MIAGKRAEVAAAETIVRRYRIPDLFWKPAKCPVRGAFT